MKIQAPAKLNLTLEVKGKREDGYHLMESDVAFLSVYDVLEFEEADRLEINSDIPNNIILKAARFLHTSKGTKITLTKNIPMGAGLGGGSSDAAAALIALPKLWGITVPESELYEMALKLGADVPVCLYSQLNKVASAHFSGIGEVITPLSGNIPPYYLLVNPNIHLATKDVFNNLKGRSMTEAAIELAPEIANILKLLESTEGNLYARMTGTGSTCFAVYNTKAEAEKASEIIPQNYWKQVATQHSY